MARKRTSGETAVYRREPEPGDLYRVSAWHGVPHFECNLCAFDTLVAGNMLAHLESHAGSEPAEHLEISEVEDNGNSG